jgi:shikimate dehydrogenase
MITGNTSFIAHIGWPTHAFRAPGIYNPYFEHAQIDCVVVPMGCRAEHYPNFLRAVFALENIRGALITMPHKVSTVALLDEASPAVQMAGACNAVRRDAAGRLVGDMFDGEGFVRGLRRQGFALQGADALVVGAGGVGSAIAASLVAAGIGSLSLFDSVPAAAVALAGRLKRHHPHLRVETGRNDPAGMGLVVNATPLGMNDDDPMPVDVSCLDASTFVGEVVMKRERTAFVEAASARGCRVQVGSDMLFEQIPAYLEFFGLPSTTPQLLRSLSRLDV